MPSWLDSWFGSQAAARPDVSSAHLKITDGDVEVDFTDAESGWIITGPQGWSPRSSQFKGGGYYANSLMVDGRQLRHTAFDNVVESWQCALNFYSADGMFFHIDTLEELLLVRAPRYWTDRRNHQPVWLERRLPGESNTAYAFVSQGRITLPNDTFDRTCTADNGLLTPVLLTFIRTPFWHGAPPGEAQGMAETSARQDWEYRILWAEETNLPAGYIYCFVETATGLIYAGGASEILRWWSSSWNVINTAPVGIAGNITSAVLLTNGDILFGDNGQIILLSSDTWSVETALPTGQVTALVQASNGVVYAGDDKQILKRTVGGTWSVDTNLPLDYVYSFVENTQGRVFAGSDGEILAQVEEQTPSSLAVRVAATTDQAEQYNAEVYTNPVAGSRADLDLFNRNYVAMRFELNIPNGATINSARARFQCDRTVKGTSDAARIYCEDTDNSSAFARVDYNVSSRTLTTAFTPWQDTIKRKRLAFFFSPDFREAVQEVVNRTAFASGNYLTVIVKSDNLSYSGDRSKRRQVQSYDQCAYNCPRLDVEYTPAPVVGAGWEIISKLPTGDVRSLLQVSSSGLMLAGESGRILGSDDEGRQWGVVDSSTPTNEVRSLYEDADGRVWAGDNGNILISVDEGRNFASDSTVPTGYVEAIIQETATEDLRAGDSGRILIRDETLQTTLGRTATDNDEVYVANHHKTCNLTDIKLSDGGVFQDLFPMSTFPTQIYPNIPAVNDALYFGADTSLSDTGPFCSLVFDIGIPTRWTTSGTITWEYYNGAWVALTTQDNANQFTEAGVNSVTWKQPSDWTAVAVDGVTGYWVRARVSAIVGTMVPCTQQNRDIYSAVWAFAELDDDQAGGNVDSLIRLKAHNRSDNGGPGGSEPLLYFNRLLIGAKEYENHEDFRAFLNFADEQNPTGVSIDVTVDADSATSVEADTNLSSATGRRVFFDASDAQAGAGLDNLADRVAIDLDTTVARDFYGTYLPFIRCKQQGGSAGEVTMRIKVVSGSGGISSLGDIQATQSTTDHEVVEFRSPISIPVSAQMTDADIGDTTSIVIQIAASAADADLYLYDLFLLPVDGPWLDAKDVANTDESAVEKGRRLAVDSISIPKAPTRAMSQILSTGAFASSWRVDGNGEARIVAQKQQKLWFMAARTASEGSSVWLSETECLYSIQIDLVNRWLTGRGAA